MGLFSRFHKPTARTSVIVDIAPDSVGGAYVIYLVGKPPLVAYTHREPVVPREGEKPEAALARALSALGASLTHEGAPLLARASGSGRIDSIIVSVDLPWCQSEVRVEHIESKEPFTFSRSMLNDALAKAAEEPPGRVLGDEALLGVYLNGYHIESPVGRTAVRASIFTLSSSLVTSVAEAIAPPIRALYHTRHIEMNGAPAPLYHAIRTLFPHEESYLGIATRGNAIDVWLCKKKTLVAIENIPVYGTKVVGELKTALESITKRQPLPRTVFLLANENHEDIKTVIASSALAPLWLSDDQLRIVALTAGNLAGHIDHAPGATPDLFLGLFALAYAQGEGGEHLQAKIP